MSRRQNQIMSQTSTFKLTELDLPAQQVKLPKINKVASVDQLPKHTEQKALTERRPPKLSARLYSSSSQEPRSALVQDLLRKIEKEVEIDVYRMYESQSLVGSIRRVEACKNNQDQIENLEKQNYRKQWQFNKRVAERKSKEEKLNKLKDQLCSSDQDGESTDKLQDIVGSIDMQLADIETKILEEQQQTAILQHMMGQRKLLLKKQAEPITDLRGKLEVHHARLLISEKECFRNRTELRVFLQELEQVKSELSRQRIKREWKLKQDLKVFQDQRKFEKIFEIERQKDLEKKQKLMYSLENVDEQLQANVLREEKKIQQEMIENER